MEAKKRTMSNKPTWRELSGEEKWKCLLNPLQLDLRRMIIHYGERVQAISDAFIKDKKSKNYGLPRYAKRHLFSEVGLENNNPYNYEVTKYFYAPTDISTSRSGFIKKSTAAAPTWIGYVAVTTDTGTTVLGRRDILITWRGTEGEAETKNDRSITDSGLTSASEILGKEHDPRHDPKVYSCWYSMYTTVHEGSPFNSKSCREQVLSEVKRLVDHYKEEEVSITVAGYSSGAAMAILNAVDIVYNRKNVKPSSISETRTDTPTNATCLVTAFGFGVPRVGNKEFRDVSSKLKNLHVLCINNDAIQTRPDDQWMSYVDDVGEELKIDTSKSPYLKVFPVGSNEANSIADNLEVYLHGVAGTHGQAGEFKLEVNREIALVNKTSDALKNELLVLDNWWTTKNKSMVQNDDGSWVLMDRESDDNLI